MQSKANKASNLVTTDLTNVSSKKEVLYFREKRVELSKQIEGMVELTLDLDEIINCEVKNISEFGCRCLLPVENVVVGINITFSKIVVKLSEQIIYSGSAKVINESKELSGYSIGLAFTSGSVDIDKINSIISVKENSTGIGSIANLIDLNKTINSDFKVLAADFNVLLQKIKGILDLEEKKIAEINGNDKHKISLQEQTLNMAISIYAKHIHDGVTAFKNIVQSMDFSENERHKEYFRTTFHPLLIGAPFIRRAYEKPLGYAGDYGLMLMFYEYQDIGNTLFEKFMHRYACNEPSAVANKNRVYFLSDLIVDLFSGHIKSEKKFKIASIACGPAKETRLFLEKVSSNVDVDKIDVVLVDHETEALAYAQSSIKKMPGYGTRISTKMLMEDAVLGIIKEKAFVNDIKDSNVIVSAGLFDYLSDRVSAKLISSLFNLLQVGGTLIIGNVSSESPDKFSMEYLMEWKLFYRNSNNLLDLVSDDIKSKSKIEVISEPLNINLFLKISKRA